MFEEACVRSGNVSILMSYILDAHSFRFVIFYVTDISESRVLRYICSDDYEPLRHTGEACQLTAGEIISPAMRG